MTDSKPCICDLDEQRVTCLQKIAARTYSIFEYPKFTNKAIPSTAGPQQLVARIKRSSKYYGQTKHGAWFNVHFVEDCMYPLRGNNNNYRISDVAFGVRLENGVIIEIKK